MTTITNTPVNRHVTNAEIEQWFADETIDITGKKLSIKRDEDGRIMKVIFDKDISDLQVSLFKAKFFHTENMIEEIGRVELTENTTNFSVPLLRYKQNIQLTMHIIMAGITSRSYRIYFNETSDSSPLLYYQTRVGVMSSLFIPLRTQNDFGLLNVSNISTQIKQGAFHASSYKFNVGFKWNNAINSINSVNFHTLSHHRYFKAGTTIVAHGWN